MRHFLMIFFCTTSVSIQAQTNLTTGSSLDAYWNLPMIPDRTQTILKSGTTRLASVSSSVNEVVSNQEGTANTAFLSILSGTQNRLEAKQTAGHNSVDASLSGINNSVLLNQTGAGNSISFGLNGINNQYVLTQNGGDRIQMQGLQQNNQHLEVSQGNGSNSLTIDNTSLVIGSGGIPNLRVEQSGGATVTIQQGKLIGN